MWSGGQEDSALIGRFKKSPRFKNQKCCQCEQSGHFQDCPKRRQQDNDKAVHKAKAVGEKHKNPDSDSTDESVSSITWIAAVGHMAQILVPPVKTSERKF